MRKASLQWICGLMGGLLACAISAQNFPEKPVTLVVPYSAGGTTDVAMRALAEATSKHLGQRVIVDNRTGVAGTLGPASIVNTRPDGYVIAQMPITVFRVPYMQKGSFDPLNDFTWIVHVSGYTFGVAVRADSPFKTWQEFIAYAKANPGKVSYSTPGHGTSLHITMEEIAQREGIQWLQVPYKGAADALIALRGGHVTAMADSSTWGEMVDAGQVRLLVTWGENRTRRWPNVPTLKDLGYGIVSNSPYGIAGPKGMDPKVVKILHDAIKKGMDEPVYQKVLERLDQDNVYKNSDDYAKFAKQLNEEQKAVIERMGLKM
ncbi:MAG TPA: tripartite tricarboxylate transporter substrate binding protein [Burkholderiales bacterium]|nr:tripartite tricarboxylate transporter substrate binding protein [Burkholderiales bacterium]